MRKEKQLNREIQLACHPGSLLAGVSLGYLRKGNEQASCIGKKTAGDPGQKPSGMTTLLNVGQVLPDNKQNLIENNSCVVGPEQKLLRTSALLNSSPSSVLTGHLPPHGEAANFNAPSTWRERVAGGRVRRKIARKGFTLIELLVVVLIIGILAAVAVPQYQKAVVKSRAAENLVRFNTLNRAQKISFLATGAFTTNLNNLDVGMNNIFCSKSGDMFVCNGGKFGLYGHFEWHGLITGQTRLACYAQNSVEVEKKLCESYYQDWGGTQTGSTIGNWIYYYGPWE